MKNLVFIFGLLVYSLGFSQETNITGSVLDGEFNNEPLVFANITIKETGKIIKTNLDGTYSIQVSPGIYTLVFDFIGYQTQEINKIEIKNKSIILDNKILYAKKITFENSIASKG